MSDNTPENPCVFSQPKKIPASFIPVDPRKSLLAKLLRKKLVDFPIMYGVNRDLISREWNQKKSDSFGFFYLCSKFMELA